MITTKRADVQTNLPRSELIEMFLSGLPSDDKLLKRRYQPLAVIETIARYAEPNRAFRAVLYALLDTLGPENRTSFWGKRKRALACGVSAKTVQRAIKAFKERGWITVTKRFTGKGSYYVHDVGITSKLIENALAGPGANARRWGTAGAEAGQKTPVQGGPAVPSSEVGQSSPEGAGSPPEGGLAVPLTKKELLTGEVELAAQESEAEATTAGTSQPPEFLAQQEREYRPQDALNRTTCESAGITVSTALRASETAASCTKPGSGLLATTPVPGAVPAPPREGHGQIPGGLAAEAGPAATPVSRTPSVEGARPAAGAQTAAVNLKSGERSEARVEIPVVSEDTINLIDYFMSEFQRRKGRPCPARFNPELVNAAISAHGLPVMKFAVDAMLDHSKAKDIGLNLLCSPKTLPIWLERAAKKFCARAASAGAPQLAASQPNPTPSLRIPDIGGGRKFAGQFGFTVDQYPPEFISRFDPFFKGKIANLLLHGPAGCGKSSLGLAIATARNGNQPLYTGLLSYKYTLSSIPGGALYLQREHFRQMTSDGSWIPNVYKEGVGSNAGGTCATWFCDLVQYVGVLLLDDCLAADTTNPECKMLSAIIRDRFEGGRPTIIVTNLNQDEIRTKLDAATCSRLFDKASSQFVSFEGADRRQLDVDAPDAVSVSKDNREESGVKPPEGLQTSQKAPPPPWTTGEGRYL